MTDVLTAFFLVSGSVFFLLAAVGAFRFPDPLMRMAAISKASTLGLTLILIGVAIKTGTFEGVWKSVLLIAVLWISTPIAAHLLARSALKAGLTLSPRTQNPRLILEITGSADAP